MGQGTRVGLTRGGWHRTAWVAILGSAAAMPITTHANQPRSEAPAAPAATDADLERADLAPRWVVGEARRYRVLSSSAEQAFAGEGGAGAVVMQARQMMEVTLTPTKVDADGVMLTMTIDRLEVGSDTPTGPVSFDSSASGDATNPLAPGLRPIVGHVVTLTLGPTGMLQKAEGGQTLHRDGAPTKPFAAQYLSAAGISRQLGPIFDNGFGRFGVAVGERVRSTSRQPMAPGVFVDVSIESSVADVEGPRAKVVSFGSFALPTGADAPKDPVTLKEMSLTRTLRWEEGALASFEEDQAIEFSRSQGGQVYTRRASSVRRIEPIVGPDAGTGAAKADGSEANR